MKINVVFKADNGFKPYCEYGSAAYKLCSTFGPTLKTAFIGGNSPIWPLPPFIITDMDLPLLFQIFGISDKSIRLRFCGSDNKIELTVPGYKEEWLTERAKQ